ncbi:MAG TPA: hypothetical protein VIW67_10900 [Terriglobales bacterium]|jgi:hypothetical protein
MNVSKTTIRSATVSLQRRRVLHGSLLVLAGLVLCSCNNPENDFKKAEQANTEQAYEAFLQRYPTNPLGVKARSRLAELLLPDLIRKNSAADCKSYLNRFSGTESSMKAELHLARLEFVAATNMNTIDGYRSFLSSHPNSEQAAEVKARLNVQLEERDFTQSLLGNKLGDYVKFLSEHPQSTKRALLFENIVKALKADGWRIEKQSFSMSTPQGQYMESDRDGTISFYPSGTTFTSKFDGSVNGKPQVIVITGILNQVFEKVPIFTNSGGDSFLCPQAFSGFVPCLASDYVPKNVSGAGDAQLQFYDFCRLSRYVSLGDAIRKAREDLSNSPPYTVVRFCKLASGLQHPDGLILLKELSANPDPSVRSNADSAMSTWNQIHKIVERESR